MTWNNNFFFGGFVFQNILLIPEDFFKITCNIHAFFMLPISTYLL